MTPQLVSFIVLAVASVATAIGVISFKNAVYSALSLIATLLFLAMFYLLLKCNVHRDCADLDLCRCNHGSLPLCGDDARAGAE